MYGKDTSYPVILRSIVPVSLPNHRDQPGHLDIHEVSFKELSSLWHTMQHFMSADRGSSPLRAQTVYGLTGSFSVSFHQFSQSIKLDKRFHPFLDNTCPEIASVLITVLSWHSKLSLNKPTVAPKRAHLLYWRKDAKNIRKSNSFKMLLPTTHKWTSDK